MTVYSGGLGTSLNATTSLDNIRRVYAFGDGIAELKPSMTPFYSLASRFARKPTNDPIFKFLEQRHIFQRRTFYTDSDPGDWNSGTLTFTAGTLKTNYDNKGRYASGTQHLPWLVTEAGTASNGGTLVSFSDGNHSWVARVVDVSHSGDPLQTTCTVSVISEDGSKVDTPTSPAGAITGQVIGSAYKEATGRPDGWRDYLYDTEGYTQIFKTAVPLMSGTAMATELRGIKNEFLRIYGEALSAHKLDIETAMLFGVGYRDTTNNIGYTWGIAPYLQAKSQTQSFTYASTGYNDFMDFLREYQTPENGMDGQSRICFTSRKVIAWLNRMDDGASSSFLKNSFGSGTNSQWQVTNFTGPLGIEVTGVKTPFGSLAFVPHPLFRADYEDKGVIVDFNNIAVRPLVGNGISRDTFVKTNVQDNDTDGRVDMIITETGLQVDLEETHKLLTWS